MKNYLPALFFVLLSSFAYAGNFTITANDSNTLAPLSGVSVLMDNYPFLQETANNTTNQGASANGSYSFVSVNGSNGYMYVNLTQNLTVYSYNNTTTSQVRIGLNMTSTSSINGQKNYTLPTLCNNPTTQLRFFTKSSTSTGESYGQCYNGSSWITYTEDNTCTGASTFSATETSNTTYGFDANYSTGVRFKLDGTNLFKQLNATGSGPTTCDGSGTSGALSGVIWEEAVWWKTFNIFTVTTSNTTNIPNPGGLLSNITLTKSGYISRTFTAWNTSNNLTANLTPLTLNFTFIDENNLTRINWTTITVTLTGYNSSTNFTTTNGTAQIAITPQDNYTITYSASGYYQRVFSYEVSASNVGASLTLYLLPQATNTTLFQANVIDLFTYVAIPNATVTLLKRNLTGTNYYQVDQCVTASDGNCLMSLNLYTVIYKFLVIYNNVQRLDSGDKILADTSITFQISITNNTLNNLISRNNISTTLTTSATSANMTWSESSNNIQFACLTVYGRYKTTYTTLNRTCATGTSGTITTGGVVTAGTDAAIAVASYIIEGNEFNYASKTLWNTTRTGIGSVGFLLIGLGVPLTSAGAFLFNPVAAIPVFGLGLYLGWAGGYISVGQGAIVLLLALALIIILRMRN